MEELFNLGISEQTINQMLELNPNLKTISTNEIKEKEIILNKINCTKNQIRNIISSNSLYLDKTNEEIINLINNLLALGFKDLNLLFDSNPYIFNLEPYEIINYINNRINKNELLEDIINDLSSNPYLFNNI